MVETALGLYLGMSRSTTAVQEDQGSGFSTTRKETGRKMDQSFVQKTVLIVHYKDVELANRMRKLMSRHAHTLGFIVNMVERTRVAIENNFPLTGN